MNTAAEILTYAERHDIRINAKDGQLKIDAPEKELTDEFLESAKQHKSDLLLLTIANDACAGLDMTPDQFMRVLNKKGKTQIINGELSASTLKNYAKQIDKAINSGVVNLLMERITKGG